MFGDMMGMMGKLKETQQRVADTKKRLDTVYLQEENTDQSIVVTINGNRKIREIKIDSELLKDKEQLEDNLVTTLNKAIEKATQMNEAELAAAAKEGMPNIPGMDQLFK